MKGCLDARAHEKPPCDRSRTVSSLSLYPYYFGDHKGHPTLVSEDTAQSSLELTRSGEPGLASADGPLALGLTEDMMPLWKEMAGGRV